MISGNEKGWRYQDEVIKAGKDSAMGPCQGRNTAYLWGFDLWGTGAFGSTVMSFLTYGTGSGRRSTAYPRGGTRWRGRSAVRRCPP